MMKFTMQAANIADEVSRAREVGLLKGNKLRGSLDIYAGIRLRHRISVLGMRAWVSCSLTLSCHQDSMADTGAPHSDSKAFLNVK